MKVSLNWVKKFADIDLPIGGLVEKIGEQLGAVEEVINLGERYQGIYVVKVVECIKHPNADKLSVCLIDDGGQVKGVKRNKNGLVEVVCGAPNVQAGLSVAWIPPGATVPSTYDKDPFVLEARELRGVVSNGMLASAKELAIGDSHEGLLVLADEVESRKSKVESPKPGTLLAEVLELNDFIIDIENKMFTHRPDCFGILGVAREIAGINHKPFKSPSWYRADAAIKIDGRKESLKLEVKNQLPRIVPRFCAIAIADVRVQPSPVWLQSYLARVGVRPINNIVDLTNYIMYETGQPLHAYDYDKVVESRKSKAESGAVLGVRLSKKGEELALLNGKTIKLDDGAVVITAGDLPIGLGGVMGGADTEVDASTKNIVLECANFEMNQTRKTSMAYGLFTDAATRFTKGQSPLQNVAVLARAIECLQEIAGGRPASQLVDDKQPSLTSHRSPVKTNVEFINSRLGTKLSTSEIQKLLQNVEFTVAATTEGISVGVPFWRTDIEIAEDIVEEVGRLYGYDKLPQKLPLKSLEPAQISPQLGLKSRLRDILTSAGANEVLTYSFVNKRLLAAAGQDAEVSYHIKNALSPDLQHYRLSLTPSLLDKVNPNIRNGFEQFALFEIGKVYSKSEVQDGLPKEFERLALVAASKSPSSGASFFWAKTYVDFLARRLNLQLRFEPVDSAKFKDHKLFQQMIAVYEPERSAYVFAGESLVGVVGEFRAAVKGALKLPAYCAGAELFLSALQTPSATSYSPLNKYPEIDQDICLRTVASLDYGELNSFILDQLAKISADHGYHYSLRPLDIFQRPQDKAIKQTTWRITLNHPERTLATTEASKALDTIAAAAKTKFKAERI